MNTRKVKGKMVRLFQMFKLTRSTAGQFHQWRSSRRSGLLPSFGCGSPPRQFF
jgi:hypothetical protein